MIFRFWFSFCIAIFAIAILALSCIGLYGLIQEKNEAKRKWLQEHKCVVDHYIANAYSNSAVYKCQDGSLWVWNNLPV